jgi:ribosome maturation factor RimP
MVRALVEPTVHRLGYELIAVHWGGGAKGPVLRLSIDSSAGIGADDCVQVSAQVSPLLDEADPIRGHYKLEVSSPGIDRPVERLEDFHRFCGYRSKILLFEGHPRRRYTGELAGVEGEEVLVVVDGQEHRVDYDTIERAHLVLDLDEYERLAKTLDAAPPKEISE